VGFIALDVYKLEFNKVEFQPFLYEFAKKMCIFWGAGLFGYWRGHRHKLSAYLYYLVRVLPAETRETVVELTFEEAQKVGLRRG